MRVYLTRLHKAVISGLILTGFIVLLVAGCVSLFGCSQKVNTPNSSVDDRLRGVEMPAPSNDSLGFSGTITYPLESLYIQPEQRDTIAVWLLVGRTLTNQLSQEKGYCVGTRYYPCEKYLQSDKTKVPDNLIVWNAVNR